ncbi:MAG TPA: hypothetical protein VH414_03850 [Lichenihabitans sp.]|jgi:hypothetical protein|nr:hypothetical protein [Lichenihabitans sp.]
MTLEAQLDPETSAAQAQSPPRERPVRHGRIVSPEAAAAIDAGSAADAKAGAYLAEAEKQFGFVGDGGLIAQNLKDLAGLFTTALVAKDDGSELVGYGFVVVDCMQTLAARLASLEDRAGESLAQCRLQASR